MKSLDRVIRSDASRRIDESTRARSRAQDRWPCNYALFIYRVQINYLLPSPRRPFKVLPVPSAKCRSQKSSLSLQNARNALDPLERHIDAIAIDGPPRFGSDPASRFGICFALYVFTRSARKRAIFKWIKTRAQMWPGLCARDSCH